MANIYMNTENLKTEEIQNEELQNEIEIQQINQNSAALILGSIASEELALADLIAAEAAKLNRLTGAPLTFENFRILSISVIRNLKFVLLKNTVLEAKLNETLNYIDVANITIGSTIENNLIALLNSIAQEQQQLGNLISIVGTRVQVLAPNLTFAPVNQLQLINEIVLTIMKVITEKNLVLLSKLRTVVRFIENNTLTLDAAQLTALTASINALLASINSEETGLANLILGEAAKLRRAQVLTVNPDEIPRLIAFNNTVTNVIDVVVQKNMILEAKLEDLIALISRFFTTPGAQEPFLAAITLIQASIAAEENALAVLINDEADKINDILSILPAVLTQGNVLTLILANDSVTTMLESITLKNMILEQKNLDIINFVL